MLYLCVVTEEKVGTAAAKIFELFCSREGKRLIFKIPLVLQFSSLLIYLAGEINIKSRVTFDLTLEHLMQLLNNSKWHSFYKAKSPYIHNRRESHLSRSGWRLEVVNWPRH